MRAASSLPESGSIFQKANYALIFQNRCSATPNASDLSEQLNAALRRSAVSPVLKTGLNAPHPGVRKGNYALN
jgi:hypothetical protein